MVASRIYKTLLQTQEGINYLNIGLMVLSLIASYIIPFEAFPVNIKPILANGFIELIVLK